MQRVVGWLAIVVAIGCVCFGLAGALYSRTLPEIVDPLVIDSADAIRDAHVALDAFEAELSGARSLLPEVRTALERFSSVASQMATAQSAFATSLAATAVAMRGMATTLEGLSTTLRPLLGSNAGLGETGIELRQAAERIEQANAAFEPVVVRLSASSVALDTVAASLGGLGSSDVLERLRALSQQLEQSERTARSSNAGHRAGLLVLVLSCAIGFFGLFLFILGLALLALRPASSARPVQA